VIAEMLVEVTDFVYDSELWSVHGNYRVILSPDVTRPGHTVVILGVGPQPGHNDTPLETVAPFLATRLVEAHHLHPARTHWFAWCPAHYVGGQEVPEDISRVTFRRAQGYYIERDPDRTDFTSLPGRAAVELLLGRPFPTDGAEEAA